MLRSASVFVVSIIILLAAFYLAERYLSPGFQACMEKHQAADANRTADDDITAGSALSRTAFAAAASLLKQIVQLLRLSRPFLSPPLQRRCGLRLDVKPTSPDKPSWLAKGHSYFPPAWSPW